MRFLCFGVGAIGTYIGGSLALNGQEVVFLERPEGAAAARQSGLRLVLPGGERQIDAPIIVDSIEEALSRGPFDYAIVAIKSYDTPALIDMLRPHQAQLPPLICLQNGVENENHLRSLVGFSRVIPGTVTSAVGRLGVGQIVLERLRGVGLAYVHPHVLDLTTVFNQAGLNAQIYNHPNAMKWSKLLTNLPANATSAILNWTPAQVFSHPGIYRLEVAQFREALSVMRAWPLPVCDLPGTPVRALAWAFGYLPPLVSQPLLKRGLTKGRGDKMPSFHIDLYGGRTRSEVEYLNGAVARQAAAFKRFAPVNQSLTRILSALAAGDLPRETYANQPEKLLAEISR